jgi:hypothetical protein
LARIDTERPQLVVLVMNRAYGAAYHLEPYGSAWLQGLTATIAALRQTGAAVLVIGPLPHPADDVPDCLATHLHDAQACDQAVADTFDAGGVAAEHAAVEGVGGSYLDVRPWLCGATTCASVVGNLLVYRDENHLTTAFATWLSPAVGAAVDEAMARAPGQPRDRR